MRIALIDADVCAYQAAATSERPIDWGDGLHTLHVFEEEAEAHFDSMIASLTEKVEADKAILAFTHQSNFRKTVLPTYKGNRSETRKPILLKHLRDRAETKYTTYVREGLEGDDCLGILATKGGDDHEYIIVTIDKDLKTIPGKHYDFNKQVFFEVDEHQANYNHMYQTLTGDTTDGFSGCPGIGPVTAKKILEPFMVDSCPPGHCEQSHQAFDVAGAWEAVVKAYTKAKLCEQEAIVQAQVARICRASDYDFKERKVSLWQPPIINTK